MNLQPLPFTAALAACVLLCLPGCYESDGGTNTDLEVNCLDVACPWQTDQGSATFGATWHNGDLGVDLSAPGETNQVSMKVVMIARNSRQFEIDAAVFRDPTVKLHVDFDFFAPGTGSGDTFWDRAPVLLTTETVPAESIGAYVLHRHVNVPSESAAFVIHLVKEGEGRAFVDELSVGHIDYVRTL